MAMVAVLWASVFSRTVMGWGRHDLRERPLKCPGETTCAAATFHETGHRWLSRKATMASFWSQLFQFCWRIRCFWTVTLWTVNLGNSVWHQAPSLFALLWVKKQRLQKPQRPPFSLPKGHFRRSGIWSNGELQLEILVISLCKFLVFRVCLRCSQVNQSMS